MTPDMTLRRVILPVILLVMTLTLVGGTVSAETPPNTLTEAERRGGWRLLFDGRSTEGFRNYRK